MKKQKGNELDLFALIWICLNFIAGITFVFNFKNLVWDGNKGVGLNLLWIDILEGLVAFICAWSFAKLIQVHPTSNGGVSQFARTGISKYFGLVGSLLNYMSLPLIVSSLVVSAVRSNFGAGSSFNLMESWGDGAQLYLDLIGFGVFLLSTFVIFVGVSKFRKYSFLIGIITWSLTAIILIFGIVAYIFNGNESINFLLKNASFSKMDSESFVNTFVTIFFTFLGVETFFTSGKMIKNRSKNMPIAISIIILLATTFYIIFGFFMIAGNYIGFGVGFADNPAISVFQRWDEHFGLKNNTFRNLGSVIIIIATILIRFNTMLNMNIVGGTTLEPLSKQGFVSHKVSEIDDKKNFPIKAILFTIVIYAIAISLFLLLPDLIKLITGKNSILDFSGLLSLSSMVLILIYFLSLISCLKLYFQKKMNLSIVEVTSFFAVLLFLIFILVETINTDIIKLYIDGGIQNNFAASLEIIYFLAFFVASIYLYFYFYKKNIEKIKQNPELYQKLLENENSYIVIEEKIQKPYFLIKRKEKKGEI